MLKLIRILLVDDHDAAALSMKLVLEQEKDFQVITLDSGEKALALIKKKEFDIFIFDLKMPEMDGHELAKKVIEVNPNAKIIIYTGYEIEPYFRGLITSGIVGFLNKADSEEQKVKTIRLLLNDDAVIPVHLLQQLRSSSLSLENALKDPLNPEEMKILEQVAIGKTNKEIAESIFKSTRTVEKRMTTIFKKLNVGSRKEAVEKAKELMLMSTKR